MNDDERTLYSDHNEKLNEFVVLATTFIEDGHDDQVIAASLNTALGQAQTDGNISAGNVTLLAAMAIIRLARMMHEEDRAPT
jgi:hypothetical protein